MSLELILGSSGSGKSHTIYKKIIEESMQHPSVNYYVLVPEQFTMQTQKELVTLHPGGGIMNIDVLSFQRLAYRVFEETGGASRQILEEIGKSLVLQKVSQEIRDRIPVLGSQMRKPGYVQEMKSLISEFMQYDITEDDLDVMIEASGRQTAAKLQDVKVLYQEFRTYLSQRYMTEEEVLDVLCDVIEDSQKVRDSVIVLDGYTGFTPIQNKLIRHLLKLCKQIYVTVTLEDGADPFTKGSPHQLFALSKKTIDTLCKLAKETHAEIKTTGITAGEEFRFKHAPSLAFLERNLFRYGRGTYEEVPEEITIYTCENPGREMEETARRIRRMVREEGYRYGEIAIVTGDLETYGSHGAQAMESADIPYFIDEKHSILMNPFVEYLRAVMEVAVQNYSYESVFRCLRCQMSQVTQDETDELENYVIATGVRGVSKWSEVWTRIYRGMDEGRILELNRIRETFMEEILPFTKTCRKSKVTVRELTVALYEYIVRCNIQQKLKTQELYFHELGEAAMEKEYAQIYGIVMSLLEKLVHILGDEQITIKEYQQLLETGLAEAKVAIIPPRGDQVVIGDMERTRLKDTKVLFFVGVNEGIVPKNVSKGGILSENDRDLFKKKEIELAPTARETIYTQKFYLYSNMTKPSRHLYLSYSKSNTKGEPTGPSYLIGVMKQLFPKLTIQKSAAAEGVLDQLERPASSMEYFIRGLRHVRERGVEETWAELYSWYLSQEDYEAAARKLVDAAFYHKPEDRISQSVAKALYGEVSPYSATRLEKFAACAYAHFLQYGLHLMERQQYEFSSMDMGNVMHKALEAFARKLRQNRWTWAELARNKQEQLVEECVNEVVADYGNTILHSSARNQYMIARVKRVLKRTVWALSSQLERGAFDLEGFEVRFEGGRIDRLDVCETKDKVYVKVIDYKSGNTSFDLLALYHGLQLQLMVYLNAAVNLEERNHPDKEIEPAGVFYYNIKDPMVKADISQDLKSVEAKILSDLKMNGLVLADQEVARLMDHSLETLPVRTNKDGTFSKTSHIATQEQFALLRSYVEKKTKEIQMQILDGNTAAAPYLMKKEQACTYCPYQSVCRFDEKIPGYQYRQMEEISKEMIYKKMEDEVWE